MNKSNNKTTNINSIQNGEPILLKKPNMFMDGPILRSTPRHVATCEFSSPKQPVEMIVAKIFAINKVAGCRKDDRARDAHAIQNTIVRF